ncbi:(2Fe-2S)-binding protein [Actinacidiphila yeochonensis]|uniref:(2Fe-2S)-binding protein n=1 Tax=Actinacidiphila yeochonensis TaxID=89050 RepID=UPI000ADBEAB5
MPVISASYDRLAAVLPALRVAAAPPRSGAGWTRAAEIAAGGRALAAFVARDTERLALEHGRAPRPDVAATLALHRYLWPVCLLFTVPWFLQRRVPRLPVEDVSFHPDSGRVTALPRAFGCLPDDPAAALPDARPVASAAALRAELRSAVAEHAGPVLAAFRPLVRRGPRALWGLVADEVAEGLWFAARLLGEEERAVAELQALLPGDTPPLSGAAGFHQRGDGPSCGSTTGGTARTRLACCLYYTLSPAGACAGCPRAGGAGRIGHRADAA